MSASLHVGVDVAPELTEAFDAIRQLTPEFAHELVTTLERRLIVAETLVRLYEGTHKLSTPGALPDNSTAGDPLTAGTDVLHTRPTGVENNVIPIGHSVRVGRIA